MSASIVRPATQDFIIFRGKMWVNLCIISGFILWNSHSEGFYHEVLLSNLDILWLLYTEYRKVEYIVHSTGLPVLPFIKLVRKMCAVFFQIKVNLNII